MEVAVRQRHRRYRVSHHSIFVSVRLDTMANIVNIEVNFYDIKWQNVPLSHNNFYNIMWQTLEHFAKQLDIMYLLFSVQNYTLQPIQIFGVPSTENTILVQIHTLNSFTTVMYSLSHLTLVNFIIYLSLAWLFRMFQSGSCYILHCC